MDDDIAGSSSLIESHLEDNANNDNRAELNKLREENYQLKLEIVELKRKLELANNEGIPIQELKRVVQNGDNIIIIIYYYSAWFLLMDFYYVRVTYNYWNCDC